MKVKKLVTFMHNSLREVAQEEANRELPYLTEIRDEMYDTMEQYNGIGLSAPQIGYNSRIIAISTGKIKTFMVNPKIIEAEGTVEFTEGCLSIPGVYGEVTRSKRIVVKYLDRYSNNQIVEFEDIEAVVIQHEIDHLNGILFIDKAKHIRFENKPKSPSG